MKKQYTYKEPLKKYMKLLLICIIMLKFTVYTFAQKYDSSFFPIGVWSIRGDFRAVDDFLFNVETAAKFHHTSFKNLHDQGFNAAYLSYDPIINTLDTILDIAEMYDMKVVANMRHLFYLIGESNNTTITDSDIIQALKSDSIELLKNSPATLGYYLYDEPLKGWIDFDVLGNVKNIMKDMTSDNPLPILSTWNNEPQMSYIDSYLNLDVLMMDAYPFEDGDDIGDISQFMPSAFVTDPMPYSDYINTVRENHCDSDNRPMWVVIQSFGDIETPENGGYWRQVYPKEIRLQVYLSIMQGAKGIWYFLYESEYPYLLGLLDVSGQPTQRLLEVMDINSEINEISETLLKLSVDKDQSGVSIDEGEIKIHYDSSKDKPEKYIIAVNTDIISVSNPTITIQNNSIGYEVSSILNVKNNQAIEFTQTETEITLSLPIEQGNGVLLKLSDETVSIDNLDLNNQIKVYPNPVNDKLYLGHDYIEIDSYEIFDVIGKLIRFSELGENNTIDVNSIKEGVYFLKVNTKQGIVTYKIVKL